MPEYMLFYCRNTCVDIVVYHCVADYFHIDLGKCKSENFL